MAAGQHNPSRRALLGAAVGLPLVGAIGAESAPPPWPGRQFPGLSSRVRGTRRPDHFTRSPSPAKAGEDWGKALAAFETAQAAVWEIEAATAGYGFDKEEALLPAHEAACEAMEAALGRMLLVPAPDLPAFAAKLELVFEHALEPHSVGEDVLAAFRGDVARLAGMA